MKKVFLLLSLCLITTIGFSQGIEFEHGTWAEVTAKAKASNKPIFVDFYTSWCGPCKVMAKNIFPAKEVGDKYNASFICYKIDAEKGEGIELAKKYEVKSYPTFVYLHPNETVIYKTSAALPVNEFITEADVALQKGGYVKEGKSVAQYKAEFEAGNRKVDFLIAYIKQCSIEQQPTSQLVDTLFTYLPAEQRLKQPYIGLLAGNTDNFFSPTYDFLAKNYARVRNTISPADTLFFDAGMRGAVRYGIYRYKGQADETIPNRIANVYATSINDKQWKEAYYDALLAYYQNVKDNNGYLTTADKYAKELLLPLKKSELVKADNEAKISLQKSLEAGEIDSAVFKNKQKFGNANVEQGAIRTMNLASRVAQIAGTPQQKELAVSLAKHAVEINNTPSNNSYLAIVQQLCGNTKQAQKSLEKAKKMAEGGVQESPMMPKSTPESLQALFDRMTGAKK